MPRVKKDVELAKVDEDLAAFVEEKIAQKVADDPRGAPITLPAVESKAPPLLRPCILDTMPVNSVLVRLQEAGGPIYTHLQTPNGAVQVPPLDPFNDLPLLAEVRHTKDGFVAMQRDDMLGIAPLKCATAAECVNLFKRHFHGARE